MRRNKPYGRAYKITEAEASAYERTSRPRKYKANPLGVTAMAAVNGRGAYRSARAVSAGRTKAERDARARRVMRNGEEDMPRRAGFLKNRLGTRRGQTPKEREETLKKRKRALATEKRRKTIAAKKRKPAVKKTTTAKRSTARKTIAGARTRARNTGTSAKQKRSGKRLAAYNAALRTAKASGLSKTKAEERAKRSAIRKVPLSVGDTFKGSTKKKATVKRKVNKKVGGAPRRSERVYERVYLTDPRTGKRKLSWMYKAKGGKLRRIPNSALYYPKGHKKAGKARPGGVSSERVVKARGAAAKRLLESGGAFVPNARKKSMAKKGGTPRQRRAGRRAAAFMAARRAGKTVKAAKAAALRKVPLAAGDSFKGSTKGGAKKKTTTKRKTTTRRKAAAPKRKTAAKRKTATKRRRTTYKPVRGLAVCKPATRRRKTTAKKTTAKKMTKARRSAIAKKAARTRARNLAAKKGSKTMRRNGRKAYAARRPMRKNRRTMRKNSFGARLKAVLKTGAFVAGGFLTHKVATGAAMTLVDRMAPTLFASPTAANWKKPAVGLGTLVGGMMLVRMLPAKELKRNATEITAGMAASFIQSVVVSTLHQINQPTWAGKLSGYSNSRAYALRGHKTSIMPEYSRLSGTGSYEQAAAGYQQAAAGMGEYFAANGTGEYFAPNSLQGVGSYEGAGQLAMQAAAGVDEIDDGIRPDSDIDGLMDLAEAAAGLRGTGEFYSAVKAGGGRVVEKRVGTQSQWIPSGPLWAGTDSVKDTQQTSTLSAGILQGPGGNGSLSS